MEETKPIGCYKCQKKPLIFRNVDGVPMEKRYGVKCEDPECPCTITIYGLTRSMAVANWNNYTRGLKKENISNFNY